jgi:hypothetical protein
MWALVLAATWALVGISVPAHAQAKPSEASRWTATRTGPRPTTPRSISCPTRHACTAIGGYDAALTYDGTTWKGPRDADGERSSLQSVSCPTTSFCAAVGGRSMVVEKGRHWGKVKPTAFVLDSVSCTSRHFCLASGRDGHIMRYDGKAWRHGPRAPVELVSVSCVSRTFCMGGQYSGSHTRTFRYTGHAWRPEGSVPLTLNASDELSCGSRTLCVAGGSGPQVSRWNGHRWVGHRFSWGDFESGAVSCVRSSCEVLMNPPFEDGDSPLQAVRWRHGWGKVTDVPGADVDADAAAPISCASTGHCVAVTADGRTLSLRGATWHIGSFPLVTDVVQQLSCPTASFCMGLPGVLSISPARVLRDGTWTSVDMPPGWKASFEVDCSSSSFCMSLDPNGLTDLWEGTSWTSGPTLDGSFTTFDCTSSTYCVASDTDGQTRLWNGSSWSVGPANAGGFESISCGAEGDCWAGTDEASVSHFDGSTWSTPTKIAPSGVDDSDTVTVSCPTTTFCAAHDQENNVYTLGGGSWSERTHLGGRVHGDIRGLSCASSTSCTVSFGQYKDVGKVARWNGSTWKTSQALPAGYTGFPQTLSCPTNSVCYLTDLNGTAWVRS